MFKNLTAKKVLKEVATTALLIFVIANVMSYFRAPKLNSEYLPSITSGLIDKSIFSTKKSKGKPLMVHIWATWCPVCKVEASNIQSVSEDFEVITIAVKSGRDTEIRAYLIEHDLNFKVINDNMSYHANTFKVAVYPTTFIYDKNGMLRFTEVGYTSTFMLKMKMLYLSL